MNKLTALLKQIHPAKYILRYQTPRLAYWKPLISLKDVQFYLYAKNCFILQKVLLDLL